MKYPIYHYEIKQGSPEWFEIRQGKLTGSHGQAIATNCKGLDTYITSILAEKYSSAEPVNYTNEDMERGNDLENIARSLYGLTVDKSVEEVGFIEYNKYVGTSPDGLVDKDGLIEIKCMNDQKHAELLLFEKIDTKYVWQMQMNLLVSGRKFIDFIGFNPNFKKDLFIKRFYPDEKAFEKLKQGFKSGEDKIKKLSKKL